MLTLKAIDSLSVLEPCGSGCPKPALVLENITIDRITPVGGGKHIRLRLRQGRHLLNAIYFSATPESASIQPGDVVDVAFNPQINSFRGENSVQLNILDIRPSCAAPCSAEMGGYTALHAGSLTPAAAAALLPDRATLALVWRYLAGCGTPFINEAPMCLCRKIVRWSGQPLSLEQLMTCLDIFRECGIFDYDINDTDVNIRIMNYQGKADVNGSAVLKTLMAILKG
jgi:single-stranded-DNA-specific exonuclease